MLHDDCAHAHLGHSVHCLNEICMLTVMRTVFPVFPRDRVERPRERLI